MRGIFGQIDQAQSHLSNQGVEEGYFFWLRRTIMENGELKFDPRDKFGRHIIYGYLQIDKIIKVDDKRKLERWMEYHPHALKSRERR